MCKFEYGRISGEVRRRMDKPKNSLVDLGMPDLKFFCRLPSLRLLHSAPSFAFRCCAELSHNRQETNEERGPQWDDREGWGQGWIGTGAPHPERQPLLNTIKSLSVGMWASSARTFSFSREARKLNFLCEIFWFVYIGLKMFLPRAGQISCLPAGSGPDTATHDLCLG